MGKLLGFAPFVRDIAGRYLSWVTGVPKGRLLEIGCGNGEYLRRMEDLGWDAQGIEPDAQAAKIAQEQLGVKVIAETLEKADLADDCFDAVVLNHVIEHIPDPLTLLRQCLRLLKPEGQMVILTPNLQGLGHRVFQRDWANLDPPRHLRLFSPAALRSTAKQAGFEVACLTSKVRYHFASWTWMASCRIRQRGKYDGKDLSRQLQWTGKLFYFVEEAMRPLWRNVGEELFLRAIKK
jgi:2-polyprenyl-3-methyl-5-hydroxy-6-metoxy-1,4-benzoquinol methylase